MVPACIRQRAGGFTLVELMVALAVMALLSVVSWRGLDAMSRAQEQTQARADALLVLQSGLAQWTADLDAMATELPPPAGGSDWPTALHWTGQSLRITRYSGSASEPGLRVVAWSVGEVSGGKTWLRWQSPLVQSRAELQEAWLQAAQWAQTPTPASRAREVGVASLVDWQVFYYRADAWTNPGSSSEPGAAIPDGVRLRLTLPPDEPLPGTLTRDWIRPTAVGRKT